MRASSFYSRYICALQMFMYSSGMIVTWTMSCTFAGFLCQSLTCDKESFRYFKLPSISPLMF